MPRLRQIAALLAALLLLLAVSGCGSDEKKTPAAPPAPTAPTTAAGPTASGGATAVAPPPGEPAKKLSRPAKKFAAELNAICRKYDSSEAEFYYINVYANGKVPSDEIDSMSASYRGLVKATEALSPPADAKAKFDTYLASVRTLAAQMAPLKAAHVSRNAKRTNELDIAFSEELLKRSNAALALGADNCIMDSAD